MPAFCQAAGRKKGGWGGMPGVPGAPGAEPRRHWLSLPSTFPAGGRGVVACLPCRCGALRGRTCFVARLPCLWVDFLPPSPQPPSPAGKGETYSFLMQGVSPLASPGLNCLRHLQNLPSRCPAGGGGLPRRHWLDLPIRHSTGVCLRHRQFGAKPIETPFFGQCRQPRRGGTGGEELRRLRWSSPPGQGVPVPPGASPPAGYHSGRDCKCRRRLNAGDARGEAPCIRKQKNLPLPRRGRGLGG